MNVRIEVIPHQEHRYTTVGDWYYDANGDIVIRVSKMSDWRHEMLVAVHELVEVLLCRQHGVTQGSVDDFDKKYEAERQEDNEEEPGDDPGAPYHHEHCVATGVERILAAGLNVAWKPYDDEVGSLPEVEPKSQPS